MKKLIIFFISITILSNLYGFDFRLSKTSQDTAKMYEGLASNGVTSIALQGDSIIWYGTGAGLAKTADFGESFVGYYTGENLLPKGSVTQVATWDSIVWVAGVYDSTINDVRKQVGGGLSVSKDYGVTWDYIPQPVYDNSDTIDIWAGNPVQFLANTTKVSNTTWDIATNGEYTYITSWAGGLQRTKDYGKTWQRVPLPADDETTLGNEKIDYKINPRDPANGGNHNHKGFSVIAYSDTVWVGTANGINRGIVKDDYIEWTKFNSQNSSISGNWVVALHRQFYNGKETIWAVTVGADNTGEYQAISKTSDGGLNWSLVLENERGYSISSHDSTVYVSTARGLFKSNDGENWALYRTARANDGTRILDETVYESKVDVRTGKPMLWLGTSDGIAKTDASTVDWEIYRAVLSTQTKGQPTFFAYPNPFSPLHQNQLNGEGNVRFQYDLDEPAKVTLEVFTFAMERVYKNTTHVNATGDLSLTWNGRADNGNYVANGTYFCKLTKKYNSKTSTGWTKLMIIK